MQYTDIWNKILNPNEVVEYEFSISARYRKFVLIFRIIPVSFFFLISLASGSKFFIFVMSVLTAWAIFIFWYSKVANAYAFTGRRILIHHGWLSTRTQSVDYDKITEVAVSEPFFSRIFTKSGHMFIHTGNVTDSLSMFNVAMPYEVKKKLDSLRHLQ